MKIIFEYDENNRIEITNNAETIFEVIDEIEKALIAYGFHPNTVKDGFLGKAEEIETNERIEKENEN